MKRKSLAVLTLFLLLLSPKNLFPGFSEFFSNFTNINLGQEGIVVGDINGDRLEDIIISSLGNTIIYMNNGGWGWNVSDTFNIGPNNPTIIPIMTKRNDTQVDYIIFGDSLVVVGIIDGVITNPPGLIGLQNCVARVADVNNDGFPDIIAIGLTNTLSFSLFVFTNAQDGYSFAVSWQTNGNGTSYYLDVGDINNDGFVDIVYYDNSRIIALTNGGKAKNYSFYTSQTITSIGTDVKRLRLADLNRDGYIDLITLHTSLPNNKLTVFHNTSGSFSGTSVFTNTYIPYNSIDVGDVNNDFYPDIIVGGEGGISILGITTNIQYPFVILTNNKSFGIAVDWRSTTNISPNTSILSNVHNGIAKFLKANEYTDRQGNLDVFTYYNVNLITYTNIYKVFTNDISNVIPSSLSISSSNKVSNGLLVVSWGKDVSYDEYVFGVIVTNATNGYSYTLIPTNASFTMFHGGYTYTRPSIVLDKDPYNYFYTFVIYGRNSLHQFSPIPSIIHYKPLGTPFSINVIADRYEGANIITWTDETNYSDDRVTNLIYRANTPITNISQPGIELIAKVPEGIRSYVDVLGEGTNGIFYYAIVTTHPDLETNTNIFLGINSTTNPVTNSYTIMYITNYSNLLPQFSEQGETNTAFSLDLYSEGYDTILKGFSVNIVSPHYTNFSSFLLYRDTNGNGVWDINDEFITNAVPSSNLVYLNTGSLIIASNTNTRLFLRYVIHPWASLNSSITLSISTNYFKYFAGHLKTIQELLIATSIITDTTPPSPPQILTISNISGSVYISWDTNVIDYDVIKINIYRSDDGLTYNLLQSFNTITNEYLDYTIGRSGTYYYKVEYIDDAGNKSSSETNISLLVTVGIARSIRVVADTLKGINIIRWEDEAVTNGESYLIYRDTYPITNMDSLSMDKLIATVSEGVGIYTDLLVPEESGSYYYAIITVLDTYTNKNLIIGENVTKTPIYNSYVFLNAEIRKVCTNIEQDIPNTIIAWSLVPKGNDVYLSNISLHFYTNTFMPKYIKGVLLVNDVNGNGYFEKDIDKVISTNYSLSYITSNEFLLSLVFAPFKLSKGITNNIALIMVPDPFTPIGQTLSFSVYSNDQMGFSCILNNLTDMSWGPCAITDTIAPSPPKITVAIGGSRNAYLVWEIFPVPDLQNMVKIERSTDASTWNEIKVYPMLTNEYLDMGLELNKTYYYRISLVDDASNYAIAITNITLTNVIPFPLAPQNLRGIPYKDRNVLYWEEVGNPYLYKYFIYKRSEKEKDFRIVGTTRSTNFVDLNVETGVAYYYYVTARDVDLNESDRSDVIFLYFKKEIGDVEILNNTISRFSGDGFIRIYFGKSLEDVEIDVYTLLGRKLGEIFRKDVSEGESFWWDGKINDSPLPPGSYVLLIRWKGGSLNRKIYVLDY